MQNEKLLLSETNLIRVAFLYSSMCFEFYRCDSVDTVCFLEKLPKRKTIYIQIDEERFRI